MTMRNNKVPRKSARSGRRPEVVTANVVSVCSSGWYPVRSRGARAGRVAAVVAGILGAAAFGAVPAHAQNATASATAAASVPPTGSAQTSQNLQEVVVT